MQASFTYLKNKQLTASLLLLLCTFLCQSSQAQTGLLTDDFATGNTFNWKAASAGSTGQIVNGQFVVTPVLQSSGKYRGDFQKTGGVTFHAGAYPIVAIKMNKPPRCNFFFDTNLGSYNGANNNATKIASATGSIYYWDLSTGKLGTTILSTTNPTTLTLFQLKIADIELTQAEIAANDTKYEVDWVRTYASVAELRAAVGVNNPPTFAFTGTFAHPGLLHNTADLQRIKGFVDNHYGRPYQSYQLLLASSRASATYNMAGPFQSLTRDASLTINGVQGGTIKDGVESDFMAAYYNALMYNITGNEAHALKATQILDAYAATTINIVGADAELNGLYGFMLANAAELMRSTYPAWSQQKQEQCGTMLRSVFYPVLGNFKPCAHGNWDIICMKALMAIAIYSNDTAMFNKVVNYFYHGEGNGSIDNYVLTAAGQLQESNRDQPHTMLALGSLAELSEMGTKQGIDLYSASGNAIMRGYEYTAKYNLGFNVDYQTAFDYCEKNYTDYTPEAISANGRGQFRAVFEIAYNHYVYSKGLQMPYTLKVMNVMGAEGAPFGADNPGYGSLFFYLNNAPNHPVDSIVVPVDTSLGLINDNFTTTADGWAAATSGSVGTVQNGQLTITLVTQTNGKKRGDVKKTAGGTLYTPNYPILAIKMKKPAVVNLTFDTNLGSYGNGSNKWTGKVGEDVYYYDLTKVGFGAGPQFLTTASPTTLPTFQFKVADISSGEASYAVDWVKTVRTVADLEALVPHITQTIAFDSLPTLLLGDTAFTITAAASSGLPLTLVSSDTTIATVLNGRIYNKRAGTVTITATQPGDAAYLAATPVLRTLVIAPLNVTVQHQDGDNAQVSNNSIRPYLKLVNQGTAAVAYKELTARYWLTAENFAGINTWIDYAQLGNSNVKMKYVALTAPRNGAYGYIEYSFDAAAANLLPGNNSGVIQSRLANTDWTNLNEADDYSYVSNSTYTDNNHITLYRNGQLVWGEEPTVATPLVKVTAYSAAQNSGQNAISTYLTLNNEGNIPVAYGDLSVRYWFTADGTSALNSWIDYAKPGNNNILRSFNAITPALTGADQYLEIKLSPSLGKLYPAAGTGNIQYRITKSDWSGFSQVNDHSYTAPAPLTANEHITVYYKGQLIYGIEPAAEQLITGGNKQATGTGDRTDQNTALQNQVLLFPNPTAGSLNIRLGKLESGAQVQVYTLKGELLLKKRITNSSQTISLHGLAVGMYNIEVRNGNTITTKLIFKN